MPVTVTHQGKPKQFVIVTGDKAVVTITQTQSPYTIDVTLNHHAGTISIDRNGNIITANFGGLYSGVCNPTLEYNIRAKYVDFVDVMAYCVLTGTQIRLWNIYCMDRSVLL